MQNILVYGTILFDHMNDNYFIGGCHTNVAAHCAKLGLDTTMVSSIGKDTLGREAVAWMNSIGIHTEYVTVDSEHPTGTVEVDLSNPQNPQYLLFDNVAYDYIRLDEESLNQLKNREFDFMYFSTSEQRHDVSTETLHQLLSLLTVKNVFFDINLRKNCYTIPKIIASLEKTDILKVNEEELGFLAANVLETDGTEEEYIKDLVQEYAIRVIIVTRSGKGASAYWDGKRVDAEAVPVEVVDTVGAGDGFSAAFINRLAQTGDIESALKAGALMGSYVSGKRSAIPEYTEEFLRQIQY